jgi:hypothetical protein
LHVRKIDADRALSWDDRSVWTEDDLAAALFMREFVQTAMDCLPLPVRARVEAVVADTDERFRSFTTDDPRPRRRVPVDGPIARDLATW